MNYFSGGYEGFLTAKVKADLPGMPAGTELAGIELIVTRQVGELRLFLEPM